MARGKQRTKDRVCDPWFQFQAGACTWSVVLVDSTTMKEAADGDEVDGLTVPGACLIFIDCTNCHDRKVVALVHEMTHAVLSYAGSGDAIEELFGCEADKVHRREEVIVATIAPMLTAALLSCGALSFPKPAKRSR